MPTKFNDIYIKTRAATTICDDGTILEGWSNPAGIYEDEAKILPDFTVKGISGNASKLIEEYNLNSDLEILLRKRLRELRNAFYEKPYIKHIQKPSIAFVRSLEAALTLSRNSSKYKHRSENLLRMMIYANIITVLEEFLSECLIQSAKNNDEVSQNIIDGNFFGNRENKKSIQSMTDSPKPSEAIIEKLRSIVFHNIRTINTLYSDAYECEFKTPDNFEKVIENRHDIVHRNGVPKDIVIEGDHHLRQVQRKYSSDELFQLMIDVLDLSIAIVDTMESYYLKKPSVSTQTDYI